MESRLIYIAGNHMRYNVDWDEWIYCGVGDDIEREIIIKSVTGYFGNSLLYIASTRKESVEINIENILEEIEKILGLHDFSVWDVEFKKVINFNRIGVMRTGHVKE